MLLARCLDSTHIRITSLEGVDHRTSARCRAGGRPHDCANTTFDAMLTVPDTSKPGSWTLPLGIAEPMAAASSRRMAGHSGASSRDG